WSEHHFDVSSDVRMKFADDSTDPGFVWQWGAWATRGPDWWLNGTRGTRTASICVLDSGVDATHGDIAPNLQAAYNAIDPGRSGADDGGHGTHVAGIAAGSLANAYGVGGAANVRILSAKVLDANGAGHESDLAFGLAWCANQGAKVAVMALSVTDADHPTLERALAFAAKRDVLLLASAGNTGGAVQYPASHPDVMAVSAVDGNLTLASFSSRGAQVDLAAPGVHVLGPLPGGQFAFGSGTSQAVAYAAGVAALVRDAKPGYTAQQAWTALTASAKDLGPAGRDDATGHGLVMVDAAMRR
ncbi:MAG TPA: S8 family serine peptidase, partial [Candidatus Thermoplasmatota archaeon]|nr:S8 family serine peptidase [Candidatus Thermoplasmatota archaeon]